MIRPHARSIATPVVAGLLALGPVGCGAAAVPSVPVAPAATSTAAPSPRSAAPVTPAPAAIPNTAILLVARPGQDGWTVIEAATGGGYLGPDVQIPVGAPRPGWSRIVSATVSGDRTTVRDDVNQPGFGGPKLELDGRWRLPRIADASLPVGVSADGSTIVLVEADAAAGAKTTRFAVVQHQLLGEPSTVGDAELRLVRLVELPGQFAYDALSADGSILYVIEHLDASAGGHYQVRAVDLPAGALRDGVIVDKTGDDEAMSGYPIAQVRRTDGVVMTLYDGPDHPFVHALQSSEAWAVCIDLAVAPGADRAAWGLAVASDGRTVYAANGATGAIFEIDANDFAVRRTARLGTTATAPFVLAKFGHSDVGPVGYQLVGLPNASGLLVARSTGVTLVNGKDLAELWTVPTGGPVDSIGVTPDGSTAFALTRDGRIVAFDPRAKGASFGEVAGGPYSGLLAVAPW